VQQEQLLKLLHAAFEMGYPIFDTATLVGGGKNNELFGAVKRLKESSRMNFLPC